MLREQPPPLMHRRATASRTNRGTSGSSRRATVASGDKFGGAPPPLGGGRPGWRSFQDAAVTGLDGSGARGFIWAQSASGTGATIYRVTAMSVDLKELTDHDHTDECPVCRAQDIVQSALLPAASAWEANGELPRFSVALQGAAELLGVMLEEGISREDIESALDQLLDDIEQRIVEDQVMGGPPKGSA